MAIMDDLISLFIIIGIVVITIILFREFLLMESSYDLSDDIDKLLRDKLNKDNNNYFKRRYK